MQEGMGIEDDSEPNVLPFSIIAAVLGIAALIITMMGSDVVGLGLIEQKNPSWEKPTDTGYTSTFGSTLPDVPPYNP